METVEKCGRSFEKSFLTRLLQASGLLHDRDVSCGKVKDFLLATQRRFPSKREKGNFPKKKAEKCPYLWKSARVETATVCGNAPRKGENLQKEEKKCVKGKAVFHRA